MFRLAAVTMLVLLWGAAAQAAPPERASAAKRSAIGSIAKHRGLSARREAETIGKSAGCRGTAAIPHDYGSGAAEGGWVVLCSDGRSFRVKRTAAGAAGEALECSLSPGAGLAWCFE